MKIKYPHIFLGIWPNCFYPVTGNDRTMKGKITMFCIENRCPRFETRPLVFSFRGFSRSGLFYFRAAAETDQGGSILVNAIVGVVMGSSSDWDTMKNACAILDKLEIPYEKKVVSAHRTPDLMFRYAETARERGLKVIIAGAGGAAHLPGMIAAKTTLPVLGVPVQSHALSGMDSLLSIVQMPSGIPVGTLAIGNAGATNAALLAARFLSAFDASIANKLNDYRDSLVKKVKDSDLQ